MGHLGFLLVTLLFFKAYGLLMVIIPYRLYILIDRADREEMMLTTYFGSQYEKYLAGKYKLIPLIY
jgi:protein-S-isoprenylcysteine O-methyltransferase Ste14